MLFVLFGLRLYFWPVFSGNGTIWPSKWTAGHPERRTFGKLPGVACQRLARKVDYYPVHGLTPH
jgi:hypothetical protein